MAEIINLTEVASSRQRISFLEEEAQKALYRRDFSTAIASFEEARSLAATAHLIFPEQAYRELARSHLEREEPLQALFCLEQGLEAYPESTKILYQLGCLYLAENFSGRNPLQAIKYFSRLKSINPRFYQDSLGIDALITLARAEARVQ